uniref:Uncharacterized protein n=1 Tax=Oryza punctata TaxID=4537 RepID=A0A0E0K3B7_ORYPU
MTSTPPVRRGAARRQHFPPLRHTHRAVDMSNYNLGPVRGQVLHRPKECTLAVLDVLVDGHEHLVLADGQALFVPLVAGVPQRAGRRADTAPSAPHRVVLFAVAIHCCFLTLRNDKYKTMQLQNQKPKSTL